MRNFGKFMDFIRRRSQISESLINDNSPLLLHISDTPSQFYPELSRIINLINPEYIIHTGDLADNIKIELSSGLLSKYQYEVNKLLEMLNTSDVKNILISLGNHDNYDIINENKGKLQIYNEIGEVEIRDNKFVFSHYSDYISKKDADVYMFGHNPDIKTRITDSGIYLNGMPAINIINLNTLEVECIEYPYGTNSLRFNQKRIRI
ncbi:MAG TPA: metallophosphoesterase [Tissierellaceae bacterium]|nr:metallophosphoesterase [Tissierellaceae bacterium]